MKIFIKSFQIFTLFSICPLITIKAHPPLSLKPQQMNLNQPKIYNLEKSNISPIKNVHPINLNTLSNTTFNYLSQCRSLILNQEIRRNQSEKIPIRFNLFDSNRQIDHTPFHYDIAKRKIHSILKEGPLLLTKINHQENTFDQINSFLFNKNLEKYPTPKEIYGNKFFYPFKNLNISFNRTSEIALAQRENQNFYGNPHPHELLKELKFYTDFNGNFLFNGKLIVISSESGKIQTLDLIKYNALNLLNNLHSIAQKNEYQKLMNLITHTNEELMRWKNQIGSFSQTIDISTLKEFIIDSKNVFPLGMSLQVIELKRQIKWQRNLKNCKLSLTIKLIEQMKNKLLDHIASLPLTEIDQKNLFKDFSDGLNQFLNRLRDEHNSNTIPKLLTELENDLAISLLEKISNLFFEKTIRADLDQFLIDVELALDEDIAHLNETSKSFVSRLNRIFNHWSNGLENINNFLTSLTTNFNDNIEAIINAFNKSNKDYFFLTTLAYELSSLTYNQSQDHQLKLETLLSNFQAISSDENNLLDKINKYYEINYQEHYAGGLEKHFQIQIGQKFLFNVQSTSPFKNNETLQKNFFDHFVSFLEENKSKMDVNKIIKQVTQMNFSHTLKNNEGKILNLQRKVLQLSMMFFKENAENQTLEIPASINEMNIKFINTEIGAANFPHNLQNTKKPDITLNSKFTVSPIQENILSQIRQVQTKDHIIDVNTTEENLKKLFWLKLGGLIEIKKPVKVIEVVREENERTFGKEKIYSTIYIPKDVTGDTDMQFIRQIELTEFSGYFSKLSNSDKRKISALKVNIEEGLSVFVQILDENDDDNNESTQEFKRAKIIGIETPLMTYDSTRDVTEKRGGLLFSKSFCQTGKRDAELFRIATKNQTHELNQFLSNLDTVTTNPNCYYKNENSYYFSKENTKLKIETQKSFIKTFTIYSGNEMDENEVRETRQKHKNFIDHIPTINTFNISTLQI